jgi:hypothetical protein
MLRVVLDTNTLVSGLLSRSSPPAQVLKAWCERRFLLLCFPAILDEIQRVLHYPRIQQRYSLSDAEIEEVIELIEENAVILPGNSPFSIQLPADPDDEMFLVYALEGEAQGIISGDHHLLELGAFQNISILTARQFLEMLDEERS